MTQFDPTFDGLGRLITIPNPDLTGFTGDEHDRADRMRHHAFDMEEAFDAAGRDLDWSEYGRWAKCPFDARFTGHFGSYALGLGWLKTEDGYAIGVAPYAPFSRILHDGVENDLKIIDHTGRDPKLVRDTFRELTDLATERLTLALAEKDLAPSGQATLPPDAAARAARIAEIQPRLVALTEVVASFQFGFDNFRTINPEERTAIAGALMAAIDADETPTFYVDVPVYDDRDQSVWVLRDGLDVVGPFKLAQSLKDELAPSRRTSDVYAIPRDDVTEVLFVAAQDQGLAYTRRKASLVMSAKEWAAGSGYDVVFAPSDRSRMPRTIAHAPERERERAMTRSL